MTLLWITNIATPYTVPVWRELGKLTDLQVACLAETEFNRDWSVDSSDVPLAVLSARPVRAGSERVLYLPSWSMLRLFRRHRPRVVVLDGWESPAFWQARLLARWYGARVVLSYWSSAATHRFSSGPVAAFRRRFFTTADGVITPGADATDTVVAMGVAPERVTTGFGTVDVDRFARARLLREPAAGQRFLFVGQLIARKNVAALIEAFGRIRSAGDTLTVVGTGPLDDDLRGLAAHLPVRFTGHLEGSDLVQAYAEADTLVLPSRTEVWGLVVNEALAAGLSVVVTRTCGVARSLAGRPDAFVVDPTTDLADDLAEGMRAARSAGPSTLDLDVRTPSALAEVLHRATTPP